MVVRVALLFSIFLFVACDDEPVPDCMPDAERWDSEIQPLVESYCGTCHGESPDFGAPFPLVDYVANLEGREGLRHVDLMVHQLGEGTMPPVGMPRPPDEVTSAIMDWASCGTRTTPPTDGLIVSAPPALAPEDPPELPHVDILAPDFAVSTTDIDRYQCFTFEAPVEEARFIRRFEMIIDQSEVLHHLVFLRDTDLNAPSDNYECKRNGGMPPGSEYLYAWAPGQGAFEFPDGGLRVEPGERFIMQIHYNNSPGLEGITDESGVRLYLAPPEGPEYGMFSPGPLGFSIPPRETRTVLSQCRVQEGTTVLAGMPHMHEIGSAFNQEVRRGEDTIMPFIDLSGWVFETQLFYSTPFTFEAGDRLVTSCTFENPTDSTVFSGTDTADEMCFNFMYVTPPPEDRFCDEVFGGRPTDVEYSPGGCAPDDAPTETALVVGRFQVGAPEALIGGEITDGRYAIEELEIFVEDTTTPFGELDVEDSLILMRGNLWIREGRATFDSAVLLGVKIAGVTVDDTAMLSQDGPYTAEGSTVRVEAECGGGSFLSLDAIEYETRGDTLEVETIADLMGFELTQRLTLVRRAD